MIEKITAISKNLKSKFYYNHDMSKYVWFRAGGNASVFCIIYNQKELEIILNSISDIPYEIIGAGSNLLIRDNGFNGIIFKLGKNFNNITINQDLINVGSSILDINLSRFALKNNIANFEFYSGIPGSIGGAIKMNAGCFGSETTDILHSVELMNTTGEKILLNKKELKLEYRHSNIPKDNIIISANYNFSYGNKNEIEAKINEIKTKRQKSQPLKSKTSGSTFKNPKNLYAAKLIEMSDCKNLSIGDAYVSDKHSNFIINTNNASATQIEDLGKMIIDKVFHKFHIKLEWEIKIIGK